MYTKKAVVSGCHLVVVPWRAWQYFSPLPCLVPKKPAPASDTAAVSSHTGYPIFVEISHHQVVPSRSSLRIGIHDTRVQGPEQKHRVVNEGGADPEKKAQTTSSISVDTSAPHNKSLRC